MSVPNFLPLWLVTMSYVQGSYVKNKVTEKGSGDVQDFFDHIEKVMDNLVEGSRSQSITGPNLRQQRHPAREETAAKKTFHDSPRTKFASSLQSPPPADNSEEVDRRDAALDFEGYQEFVFRPLYTCDRFDVARRYCVFFRQLGTTLTLGVEVGEGLRRGVRIYWYRYLKKKQFDHFIREPLNRDFLPWNLNLGGSENELRISPITETDLSYNYFAAELEVPRSYRERYGKKPSIRFNIEPINIDMGSLYHGEEIIVYARSFMELPRTSISFLWSLYDSNDFEDRGLPSNMRMNADKSSVIIKELKTYQNHILTCKVYSNKNVLLARRNFLFRGFANDKTSEKVNLTRHKRDAEEAEELLYDDPHLVTSSESQNPSGVEKFDPGKASSFTYGSKNTFQQVPEISKDLFYDNEKFERSSSEHQVAPHNRLLRSDEISSFFPQQNVDPDSIRRQAPRELTEMHRIHDSEELPPIEEDVLIKQSQPEEHLRFEDKESQSIASCSSKSDCNVHATCTRAPFSGQNFCKCLHGYYGNGIFCFSG